MLLCACRDRSMKGLLRRGLQFTRRRIAQGCDRPCVDGNGASPGQAAERPFRYDDAWRRRALADVVAFPCQQGKPPFSPQKAPSRREKYAVCHQLRLDSTEPTDGGIPLSFEAVKREPLLRLRREPRAHLSQKGRGVMASGHAMLWNLSNPCRPYRPCHLAARPVHPWAPACQPPLPRW
jgi:hypothetical protein